MQIPDLADLPPLHGDIIFATPHGSRLYGFQTESSDEDWFIVTTSHYTKANHRVIERKGKTSLDVTHMGWNAFLEKANAGSHQSLEAAFSKKKLWVDPKYEAFLAGLTVPGDAVHAKYRRTIRKFSFGEFKQRRHAVRLAGDLVELHRRGRFDPTLTFREASFAGCLAESLAGNVLSGVLLSQF